jgi:hypothetical protein
LKKAWFVNDDQVSLSGADRCARNCAAVQGFHKQRYPQSPGSPVGELQFSMRCLRVQHVSGISGIQRLLIKLGFYEWVEYEGCLSVFAALCLRHVRVFWIDVCYPDERA